MTSACTSSSLKAGTGTRLRAAIQQAWATTNLQRNLAEAGLDRTAIDRALSTTPLEVHEVATDDSGGNDVGMAVGMAAAVLLFLALQLYGGFILMGVIEEKVSSVVEVLLARVPATRAAHHQAARRTLRLRVSTRFQPRLPERVPLRSRRLPPRAARSLELSGAEYSVPENSDTP